jgi:hypothetical protein
MIMERTGIRHDPFLQSCDIPLITETVCTTITYICNVFAEILSAKPED